MRFINKRTNEPLELIAFKKRLQEGLKQGIPMPSKPYDALGSDEKGQTFKNFKKTLAKEQGYICAYCTSFLIPASVVYPSQMVVD